MIKFLLSFIIKSAHLPTITQESFLANFFINSDSFMNNSSLVESPVTWSVSKLANAVLFCSFSSIYSSDNPVSLANFVIISLS